MAEKEEIFSSKVKYEGIFDFQEFYKFCHQWLIEEMQLDIMEDKYSEKISGDSKGVKIEWTGTRKVTDYFKFSVNVKFEIFNLINVEITQNGRKIKTNNGIVEAKVKSTLIRDYDGKFEKTATKKFMRSVYEKWVIASRIEQFETKLISDSNEFLAQAKAFLDLEGKK
ncbi:MAG: hypothetical protein ABIE36_01415 [Candidatus Diapherotrites archaeon]